MSSKLDLHETLRRHPFDHAFLCTYNFQPDFFEGYCLEHFKSLENNNNITVIMDGRELDSLLCGPPAQWPKQANTRYLLHGVRPKASFHAKLFLLISRTRALLVLGSANLTRQGLTRNAELARAFTMERGKEEAAQHLFQAARRFLGEVASRWPTNELERRLQDLDADAPWICEPPAGDSRVRLLHNLSSPLLPQLKQGLETPVHDLSAVSPFFDEKPLLLDWVSRHLDPRRVSLLTTNGATCLTQDWLQHPMLKSGSARLLFSDWSDKNQVRQLHGKALAIRHGTSVRLAFGSANFTRAALLSTPEDGNVEVLLVLDGVRLTQSGVHEILDPKGDAKSEPLLPTKRPVENPHSPFGLRLIEASLEELEFRCTLDPLVGDLEAELGFPDGSTLRVPVIGAHAERHASFDDVARRRADQGSTVVSLVGARKLRSNPVLLLNLKDLESWQPFRKTRRIRDAQRSAAQFAEALKDLLKLKETDPLQVFLTYCDIPLAGVARVRGARQPFVLGAVRAELQPLGEKNLREYAGLQEAVLGFCRRHTDRLSRHAAGATLDSIPGCMHIIRSVAGVLATQVERLLAGLSAVQILTVDQWFDVRKSIDELLEEWQDLLQVVSDKWLPILMRLYRRSEVTAALMPDVEGYRELAEVFQTVRDRVCRHSFYGGDSRRRSGQPTLLGREHTGAR